MKTKGIFIDIPVELDTPRVYPPKSSPLVNTMSHMVERTLLPTPKPPGGSRPLCPPYKRMARSKLRRHKGLSVRLGASTIRVVYSQREVLVQAAPSLAIEDWPQTLYLMSEEG